MLLHQRQLWHRNVKGQWKFKSIISQKYTKINTLLENTLGDQVVIAGGRGSGYLRSTEVLHLSNRTIVYAGDMNSPRGYFRMATITMNGQQTLLAFGGYSGSSSQMSSQNSVEQFNTNNNTWTLAPNGGGKVWIWGSCSCTRTRLRHLKVKSSIS